MPTEGPQRRDGSPSPEESNSPDDSAANGSATGSDEHPSEPHAWPDVELDPEQAGMSESAARDQSSVEHESTSDGELSTGAPAAPEVERTSEIRLAPDTRADDVAESAPGTQQVAEAPGDSGRGDVPDAAFAEAEAPETEGPATESTETEDPPAEGPAAEDSGEAGSAKEVNGAEAGESGADDAAGSETTASETTASETTATIAAAQSPAETTASIPTAALAAETTRSIEIPPPSTDSTATTGVTTAATSTTAVAGTTPTTDATDATQPAETSETTEIRPAPIVESSTDTQPTAGSDVESSSETEIFGAVPADAVPADAGTPDAGTPDAPSLDVAQGPPPADAKPAGTDGGATPPGWSRQRRATVVAAAVLGVLAALYGLDLLLSKGEIPRDVSVAGIDIAGMSHAAAERELRSQIEPRLRKPAQVAAGDVQGAVDPGVAKVAVDWDATVRRAGEQPLSPWSRLMSFFVDRPVEPMVTGDEQAVGAQLAPIGERVNQKVTEGSIRFEGARPIPVKPVPGRRLEMDRAVPAVLSGWVRGGRIELPVRTVPVRSSEQDVRQAMERIAKPAVSGPVTLRGKGNEATLTPDAIGAALRFEPADDGRLRASLDPRSIAGAAGGELASTERPSKDARITFPGKKPVVKPSVNGRKVDWGGMAKNLMPVLKRTDNRALNVRYTSETPKLTTEQLKNLGINEVIGEFTTEDFAYDSGINIRRVAEEVNGAIVRPGKTFSLNGHTGPRGIEQGYIAAGVIKQGEASRAVGGGISQFATTMYNAAYFAAMKDVEHKEHSYYISRYPMAREATVFQNPDGSSVIDLKWKNEYPTGVAVQTVWTPSSITVRLWGTKRYDVKSVTGEPFAYTAAPTITKQPGESCTPTSGSSGFSATDTQIVRDLDGNEVRRNTRTVRYNGHPQIVCPKPPEEDKEKDMDKPKPDEKPRR